MDLHQVVGRARACAAALCLAASALGPVPAAYAQTGGEPPPMSTEEMMARVMPALREQPSFALILERRPQLEPELEKLMHDAYETGGVPAIYGAAFAWVSARMGEIVPEVVPHARDEDLEAWLAGLRDMVAAMAESDPFLCHDLAFGQRTGHAPAADSLSPELLSQAEKMYNDLLPPLVRNADPEAVFVPADEDLASLQAVVDGLIAELGEERLRFVDGERPTAEEDARAVCRSLAGLYVALVAHPRGVQIARILLAP